MENRNGRGEIPKEKPRQVSLSFESLPSPPWHIIMGEPHINSKAYVQLSLSVATQLVTTFILSSSDDAMPGTTNSARNDFYDKFKREADEHDRDFIKKYDDDLNTTLIFVSLFPHSPWLWR